MLQTIYRPLAELNKLPNNPRTIKDKAFKTLCDSLLKNADYFEARPLILSDRTGELIILAGNQRYEAAKAIGLTEVPTVLIAELSEEREREIIIRDNVNNGEWNMDDLANEWSDLPLADWGLPVTEDWLSDPSEKGGEFDKDEHAHKADSYLNGAIRQIVLYFDQETHLQVLNDLERIGQRFEIVDDNTAVFMGILNHYKAAENEKAGSSETEN